jgi:hypothetical protein
MRDDASGLSAPLGEPGSGFARYAAAMSLYQQGAIDESTLEVFRICAPDDRLDPLQELVRLSMLHDLDFLRSQLT